MTTNPQDQQVVQTLSDPNNQLPAPSLTPQQQEAVQAFREKWKGAAKDPDQKILSYLSSPKNFRAALPDYAEGLDDSTILHNMSPKTNRYATSGGSGVQEFPQGSPEEAAFLKQNPKAVPIQAQAPPPVPPPVALSESIPPQVVRAATSTLPALGVMGGGAAGAALSGPGAVAGGATGAVLGNAAGKQAEIAANNAIFDDKTSSTAPYTTAEGLKDTAITSATSVMGGAMEGAGAKILAKEAANKAAAVEGKSVGQQITDQLAIKQGMRASATKVANLVTEATDDGVTLDPHKDLNLFVNKMAPAAKQEFLDKVYPKIIEIGDSIVSKTPKGNWDATPTEVLKYRDAAYDMMKNDPELEPYAEDARKAITKTLQGTMKEEGYSGFTTADNKIAAGTKAMEASSKLGKIPTGLSAEEAEASTKTPKFQQVPIPQSTPPLPNGVSPLGGLMKQAVGATNRGAFGALGRLAVRTLTHGLFG